MEVHKKMTSGERISEATLKSIARDRHLLDKLFSILINEALWMITYNLRELEIGAEDFSIDVYKNKIKVVIHTPHALNVFDKIVDLKKRVSNEFKWLFIEIKVDLNFYVS